jgi:branched-chain amino acid aminotransferase
MPLKVYIDGRLYDKDDAKISVYDHGLLYGDGVFEGLRSYGGKVWRLDEHVRRLYESAKAILLTIPLAPEALKQVIHDTLKANALTDAYVRVVVTRGVGYLGLDPARTFNPSVIVITDQIALFPKEYYEKGLALVTVPTIRNHPMALSPRVKSLNYLNNILAKIEAKNAGGLEALMLNVDGQVSECTGENIFIVRRGRLMTPPLSAGILEGVTRGVVFEIAAEWKMPADEVSLFRHDIFNADECFMCGTAVEICPVTKLDGREIGAGKPGPVTGRLLKRFQELTRSS